MSLRDTILNFPDQITKGRESAQGFDYREKDKIVISGMGGSMIPAQMLQILKPGILLNEYYDLPTQITSEYLSICISWSGNTEETLSAYTESLKRDCSTIVITGGGRLKDLATTNNTPCIVLTPDQPLPPRFAVGYMLGVLLELLGIKEESKLNASVFESEGQRIAEAIDHKAPLVYASYQWQYLARFWKILFNENAKIHAFANSFPSLDHNELAGFSQNGTDRFTPIVFEDPTDDDARQIKNSTTLLAILSELGYNPINVKLSGKTTLSKVLNSYILGLWTSYYLAQHLNVDPQNTDIIERFKRLKPNE